MDHHTTPPAPNGSDLCLPCGLCCEGVLHGYALLAATEMAQAQGMGLQPETRDGGHLFPLPCPLYRGNGCPTYRNRPAVCHDHQCELLGKYLEGEMGLAECLALADQVHEMVRAIHRRLGPVDPAKRIWLQAEEYRQKLGESDEGFQQTHAELVQDLAALKSFCRRHFNPRGIGTSRRT